ncbi:hypothetical protein T492DRAFT_876380 [Pavlovales sp. CCMP2436]|nr:hypothetical protein T492DRAFT_876380 [Pavlovales sp. CCMP2436]
MPLARVLLLIASTSVGAFAGVAANLDCTRIRVANTRLLHLADVDEFGAMYLGDHSRLIAAGWQLGVLFRECNATASRPYSACDIMKATSFNA